MGKSAKAFRMQGVKSAKAASKASSKGVQKPIHVKGSTKEPGKGAKKANNAKARATN